jgi:nucleoside-diphosphate-sugar epimerase
MRVLVAGAGGAMGRRLVPQLVVRGHQVWATTRTLDKTDALRDLGAEPVLMDGLDADSVRQAVQRAQPEVVVHQMTALIGANDLRNFDRAFAVTNRLRTEGTDHLLAASTAAGVRRFVAQSYSGWPNGTGGPALHTEDDPLDPDPPTSQRETLAAIRHVEAACASAPLEGIALRYGSFYGPGTSDAQLLDPLRKRRIPLVGNGGGVWSWLHIDDAARATVCAIEAPNAGGTYNVVDDDPAPVAEWLPYLATCIGAPRPMRIPAWLARPIAGEAVVRMMTAIRGSSNAKAKRELGWQPRWASWREGFRDGLRDPVAP